MTMFASERACRYQRYMSELHPDWSSLKKTLETACYERQPSDDIEHPMDKILDGLIEMHCAGLWHNKVGTGPGDVVDKALDNMMAIVRFARAIDTTSPKGTYDDLLNMEDSIVEMKRKKQEAEE